MAPPSSLCSIVFFSSLARSSYLFLFSFTFSFTECGLSRRQNPRFGKFSFFLLLLSIIWSGRLTEIRWSVCISKSLRRLCVSFSRTNSGFCIYHLFIWSNPNFLHDSQWITFSTKSWLVLYCFSANLLHSLIGLIISSPSPLKPHLLLYCGLLLLLLFFSFESFSHQRSLVVFHWNLRDSKSSQVSRTLLGILADLNNAIVWMVTTRPLISNFSNPFVSIDLCLQYRSLYWDVIENEWVPRENTPSIW